ncbi:MAG: pre-peptidase C-terminal domain-containing protein [Phycisphaerales bacterium]
MSFRSLLPLTTAGSLALCLASSALAVGPCPCLTDLNTDGQTDAADLGILLGAWGGSGDADFDNSGSVDAVDLGILLGAWGPCVPPPNDSCANAILLTGTSLIEDFCTAAATTSVPPVPAGACGGSSVTIGKDIWYRYVAPYNGVIIAHTCTSNFDTVLAAYGSTLPGNCACPSSGISFATLRACNDDSLSCGVGSFIEFPVSEGDCIALRVGGYTYANADVAEGYGELFVETVKEGDRCDIAHPLPSSLFVVATGTNAGDTWVQADLSSCAVGDEVDEWYSFVVPCTGTVTIDTCDPGTDFDTTLSVFADCSGNPNSEIACNDDSTDPGCQIRGLNRKSRVTFNATGGETVYIRVSGYQNAVGNFVLTVDVDCIG